MGVTLSTVLYTVLATYWSVSAGFAEAKGEWMKAVLYSVIAFILAMLAGLSLFFH